MEYLDKFVMTVIGVLATGFAGLLIASIKGIFSIKKNVDIMVVNGKKRAAENQLQFQMFRCYGKGIEAQSTALKTIIEVTAKKEINGNVEKALSEIARADKELTDANRKYEEFSDTLVGFQDIEGARS